jgi:pimeloyl-ACP methyl ester carboxylesterase
MTRPNPQPMSILERIVENPDCPSNRTVIGLHDAHARLSETMPLLREMTGGQRLIVPRSARWSGYGDGGRYSWFSSISPPSVEPIGFGDSLIQLEALTLEYATAGERAGTVLVGIGQGGTMALCLAALWPEVIKGVIAIEAFWPEVAGWELPERDMSPVHVLLISSGSEAGFRLTARGAKVEEMDATAAEPDIGSLCRRWIHGLIGREI